MIRMKAVDVEELLWRREREGKPIVHVRELLYGEEEGKPVYSVYVEELLWRKRERIRMAGVGPISQDLEPVVIRKKAPNDAAKKDEKAVNAAGAEIETVMKYRRVPTELKKAIMQARLDKKLTQAQLAQMINEKPQIIQEYESGKAIPNQQIIGKMERALSANLGGKK